jgi:hypothetical protein
MHKRQGELCDAENRARNPGRQARGILCAALGRQSCSPDQTIKR